MTKQLTEKHKLQRVHLLVAGSACLGSALMAIVTYNQITAFEGPVALQSINRLIYQDQYRFAPAPTYLELESYDHSQAIIPMTEALWLDFNEMILARTSITDTAFVDQQHKDRSERRQEAEHNLEE
jgi:hypothetical protein